MKRLLKWLGVGLVAVVCAVMIGVSLVWAVSNRRVNHHYDVGGPWLAARRDPNAVARGQHLAQAIAKCVHCHGEDLGGTMFIDDPVFARLPAPNITRGRGGLGLRYSDEDLARVIMHGVKRDGRGAAIMPAEVYRNLSAADLGAIVAYVRSVPNVDRTWPAPVYGPIFRMLTAFGQPVFAAAYIDHAGRDVLPSPEIDTTPAYGQYLTRIGGCNACHNPSYSGGKTSAGDPKAPPAANLTPAGIGGWTEADFVKVLRTGKRYGDNAPIDNNFMPWRESGRMTDAEMHAIWLFLQTLPPRDFGKL